MTTGIAARRRPSLITWITVSILAVSACGGGSSRATSSAARPSTPATLQILSPAPNERTGPNVVVRLRLDHALVVPGNQVGGKLRTDRGHVHLTLDGELVAMVVRLAARLPDVTPGTHTLEAEFVGSDHLPFANRVVAAVTFRVR